MNKTLYFSLIAALLILCHGCGDQQRRRRGPRITSPEVHPDRTVTFRYMAPEADTVKISIQFEQEALAMNKDDDGVWSITLGPVEPDIYPYYFLVDGIQVMDPGNPLYFTNERFKNSLVDIPGDTPLVHSLQDVPHGTVTYEYYNSGTLGLTGRFLVYTPPGYDENPDKVYPVFYLISGTTDTDETYFKVGHTNLILDNLIASGEAKPMIIVMPYGNPAAYFSEPGTPPPPEREDGMDRFAEDLINDIMPFVEKNYRILTERESRAIGGFSRGGGQALRVGLGNIDKFSYVCAYASYLREEQIEGDFKEIFSNPEKTNRQLKLLWISVGTEDFLYEPASEFINLLEGRGIEHKTLISSGGHTWMNARLFLAESVTLFFRD